MFRVDFLRKPNADIVNCCPAGSRSWPGAMLNSGPIVSFNSTITPHAVSVSPKVNVYSPASALVTSFSSVKSLGFSVTRLACAAA